MKSTKLENFMILWNVYTDISIEKKRCTMLLNLDSVMLSFQDSDNDYMRRIEEEIHVSLSDYQFGFRRIGTRKAILILRKIVEKHIRKDKIIFLSFIELDKSFVSNKICLFQKQLIWKWGITGKPMHGVLHYLEWIIYNWKKRLIEDCLG